jgi:hypothetical protein
MEVIMTVSVVEAKQNLEQLIQAVEQGEYVVIRADGREYELSAKSKKRGGLGSLKGWKMSDDFDAPLEDMKEYSE